MPVVVTAHAKTKQLLGGHSRHHDRAGTTTLGFLLADGAGVGLLGAGNDGELSGLQVDRAPAQSRDLTAAKTAERRQDQRNE